MRALLIDIALRSNMGVRTQRYGRIKRRMDAPHSPVRMRDDAPGWMMRRDGMRRMRP